MNMNYISACIKASRLQSQSYIFLPILFGQAYYVFQGNKLDWTIFIIIQLFGLFDQLYIVYANDYADIETDLKNKTFNIFSGGSRVLVDGDLTPSQLKNLTLSAVGLCFLCGIILTLFFHRWLAVPIVTIALGILWMYSYAPVKLSYRGGGEFLQMLGVGLVLPLFGYYAQAGTLNGFPWPLMLVILPTQLACAMATSLPDEPSDRSSKKKTATVLLGANTAKFSIIGLNAVSMIMLPIVGWLNLSDPRILMILSIPASASIIQLFFIKSEINTLKLTIFVFLSVLVTLSIVGCMTIALLIN